MVISPFSYPFILLILYQFIDIFSTNICYFIQIFAHIYNQFKISNSSPTYRGSHQIDVGDFLLKYVN